jgi:HPt (histidine-containing phosphotransfer) domain-containing protein
MNELTNNNLTNEDNKLFDLSRLIKMSNNNNEFVIKMVNLFIENTSIMIDQLASAQQESDFEKVKAVAHKLKSSVDIICIASTKEMVVFIEQESLSENKSPVFNETFAKLLEVLRKTIVQLKDVKL